MKYKIIYNFKNDHQNHYKNFMGFTAHGLPVDGKALMLTKYRANKIKQILKSFSYINEIHVVKCQNLDISENNKECTSMIDWINRHEL